MKIELTFNPDYMTIAEAKEAARIMRDLMHKRKYLEARTDDDFTMTAESFLNTFDTLTQNVSTD